MGKRITIILALLTFGLSAFLAGLHGGYQLHFNETTGRGLYHGDNFFPLLRGYLWISFAMLLLMAFTAFGKGIFSRIGSIFAVSIAIFFFSLNVWGKNFFFGEILESGVFTWAFPIDILIGLFLAVLLVLQFFRKTHSTKSDTSLDPEKLPN